MMRGRQIGTWISQRQAAEPARQESWSSEQRPPRRLFWRITRWGLLIVLIAGVAWWLRREGGYRRFMASLREGKIDYIEFQPYPNSAFVRINNQRDINGVGDFLRDGRPIDSRYGAIGPADCEMRIVMADGSTKRIWVGSSGPMRSGGTLVASNTYIRIKGDGWERVAFSNGLG